MQWQLVETAEDSGPLLQATQPEVKDECCYDWGGEIDEYEKLAAFVRGSCSTGAEVWQLAETAEGSGLLLQAQPWGFH